MPAVRAGTAGREHEMKLLLVDDHALFRDGMELMLRHLDPQSEVLHAGNVDEALGVLQAAPPVDLLLLDLHMPGMQRLDALHAVRRSDESVPVVVLSGSEDEDLVFEAIDAGAMGFIRKQFDSQTMRQALRVVLEGGICLPPSSLDRPGGGPATLAPPAPAAAAVDGSGAAGAATTPAAQALQRMGISQRQGQVLAEMAKGHANKVIARRLGITEATVKSHLAAAFECLAVHSRTEAVYALARLGLRLTDLDEAR